jgi:predicted DNA-binding transcriptional regulator AlpA
MRTARRGKRQLDPRSCLPKPHSLRLLSDPAKRPRCSAFRPGRSGNGPVPGLPRASASARANGESFFTLWPNSKFGWPERAMAQRGNRRQRGALLMADILPLPATGAGQAPILVDAHHAAALLGIGLRTLRAMDASGRLPAPVRLSRGCVRWRLSELREWIDAGAPNRAEWAARRNAGR